MGKSRRSKALRREAARQNPVGIPSVRSVLLAEEDGLCLEDDDVSLSPYVKNVITQLSSHCSEERGCGLMALSAATQDPELLQEIKRSKALSLAVSLLLDTSPLVREPAATALRNLCEANPSISELLLSNGVLKAIFTTIKKNYTVEWMPSPSKKPSSSESAPKISSVVETFIQLLIILKNLSENGETVIETICNDSVLDVISKCLEFTKYGTRVAVAGAELLVVLSEEMKEALKIGKDFEALLQKLNTSPIADEKEVNLLHLQTLGVALSSNLHKTGANFSLVERLGEIVGFNVYEKIKQLSSALPLESNDDPMEVDGEGQRATQRKDDESVDKAEKLLEDVVEIETILETEVLGLELLSNFFLDEDDEAEEVDDELMDEDIIIEAAEDENTSGSIEAPIITLNPGAQVSGAFGDGKLVDLILEKCKPLPENVNDILRQSSMGKDVFRKFTLLRQRGFLTLQNLITSLDLRSVGGEERLKTIYFTLKAYLANYQPQSNRGKDSAIDLLESMTSVLRSLFQKASQEKISSFGFTIADIDMTLSLYGISGGDVRVETNVIRILASIGLLVSRNGNGLSSASYLLARIGGFYLECLFVGGDREDVIRSAEILDSVYDVFGEDDYNGVLKELHLIQRLEAFQPQFKRQIRKQRGKVGAIVETSHQNLSRFIKYKKKMGC